jgi:hypothetical protein
VLGGDLDLAGGDPDALRLSLCRRLRPLNRGSRGDDPKRDYGWNGVEMADMNKFSEQVIDLAERFADITDAAQGKGNRKSMGARWLIIPAAGAGLYALGASGSFKRSAKKVMSQAKERASELPEDLMNRVQQTSGTTQRRSTNGRQTTRKSTTRRRQPRRKTTTAG